MIIMFFKKKSKKMQECPECGGKVENKFSYCPYCGASLIDEEDELAEFGMLGRNDISDENFLRNNMSGINMGVLDKVFTSLMNNLMESMGQQFPDAAEIKSYPGGIRIKMGTSVKRKPEEQKTLKKTLTAEQEKKISEFPRVKANTSVKRLGNKIIYELNTPEVASQNDIFVAKIESGYEIKAIADKKIYTNTIPVNLPLTSLKLKDGKILLEFSLSG